MGGGAGGDWKSGKTKEAAQQMRKEQGEGLSPTMGRNSRMFPVRFPSMICQWNMSWRRLLQSELPQAPPCFPVGEHGP